MARTEASTARRLLRIALGGAILSVAWLAVDLATAEPAAAAQTIDLDLTDTVSTVVGIAQSPTAPAITPLVDVVDESVTPLVTTVTAPIAPIVEPVLTPALTPVLTPVIAVVTAVVEPLIPVVDAIVATELATLARVTPSSPTVLAAGGALLLGLALVGAVSPSIATPGNRSPRNTPFEPATAAGSSLAATLASGVPTNRGTALPARSRAELLPASPTFVSDTTPD